MVCFRHNKGREGTMAIMRARIESDYHELQVIIEHMNVRQVRAVCHCRSKEKIDDWSSTGSSGEALRGNQTVGRQDLGGASRGFL